MDTEALNLLKRAGLNEYESKAYLGLLAHGTVSASDISDIAEIPRPRAYDVLAKLEKKGFVAVQPGRPTKFAARDMAQAFASLREYKTRKHNKGLSELEVLERHLVKRVKNAKPQVLANKDEIWMLTSRTNIMPAIDALINNAQQSIIMASDEEGIKRKLETFGDALINAKKRGVNVKIFAPKKMEHSFEHVNGDKHRMMIIDNNVVFFLNNGKVPKEDKTALIKSDFVANNLRKML